MLSAEDWTYILQKLVGTIQGNLGYNGTDEYTLEIDL